MSLRRLLVPLLAAAVLVPAAPPAPAAAAAPGPIPQLTTRQCTEYRDLMTAGYGGGMVSISVDMADGCAQLGVAIPKPSTSKWDPRDICTTGWGDFAVPVNRRDGTVNGTGGAAYLASRGFPKSGFKSVADEWPLVLDEMALRVARGLAAGYAAKQLGQVNPAAMAWRLLGDPTVASPGLEDAIGTYGGWGVVGLKDSKGNRIGSLYPAPDLVAAAMGLSKAGVPSKTETGAWVWTTLDTAQSRVRGAWTVVADLALDGDGGVSVVEANDPTAYAINRGTWAYRTTLPSGRIGEVLLFANQNYYGETGDGFGDTLANTSASWTVNWGTATSGGFRWPADSATKTTTTTVTPASSSAKRSNLPANAAGVPDSYGYPGVLISPTPQTTTLLVNPRTGATYPGLTMPTAGAHVVRDAATGQYTITAFPMDQLSRVPTGNKTSEAKNPAVKAGYFTWHGKILKWSYTDPVSLITYTSLSYQPAPYSPSSYSPTIPDTTTDDHTPAYPGQSVGGKTTGAGWTANPKALSLIGWTNFAKDSNAALKGPDAYAAAIGKIDAGAITGTDANGNPIRAPKTTSSGNSSPIDLFAEMPVGSKTTPAVTDRTSLLRAIRRLTAPYLSTTVAGAGYNATQLAAANSSALLQGLGPRTVGAIAAPVIVEFHSATGGWKEIKLNSPEAKAWAAGQWMPGLYDAIRLRVLIPTRTAAYDTVFSPGTDLTGFSAAVGLPTNGGARIAGQASLTGKSVEKAIATAVAAQMARRAASPDAAFMLPVFAGPCVPQVQANPGLLVRTLASGKTVRLTAAARTLEVKQGSTNGVGVNTAGAEAYLSGRTCYVAGNPRYPQTTAGAYYGGNGGQGYATGFSYPWAAMSGTSFLEGLPSSAASGAGTGFADGGNNQVVDAAYAEHGALYWPGSGYTSSGNAGAGSAGSIDPNAYVYTPYTNDCVITWKTFAPQAKLPAAGLVFNQLLPAIVEPPQATAPNAPYTEIGTGAVALGDDLSVTLRQVGARSINLESQIKTAAGGLMPGASVGLVRMHLTFAGVSIESGDPAHGGWAVYLRRDQLKQADGTPIGPDATAPNVANIVATVKNPFTKTATARLADTQCKSLSAAQLLAVCGIVFVRAGAEAVPAYQVKVRSWYDGVGQYVWCSTAGLKPCKADGAEPNNTTTFAYVGKEGVFGLFNPQYTDIADASAGMGLAPWNTAFNATGMTGAQVWGSATYNPTGTGSLNYPSGLGFDWLAPQDKKPWWWGTSTLGGSTYGMMSCATPGGAYDIASTSANAGVFQDFANKCGNAMFNIAKAATSAAIANPAGAGRMSGWSDAAYGAFLKKLLGYTNGAPLFDGALGNSTLSPVACPLYGIVGTSGTKKTCAIPPSNPAIGWTAPAAVLGSDGKPLTRYPVLNVIVLQQQGVPVPGGSQAP